MQAVDKPRQRLDCPRLVRGCQSARSYATLLVGRAPHTPHCRCAPREDVWSCFSKGSVLRFESPGQPRYFHARTFGDRVLLSGLPLLFFLSGDDAM